MIIRAAVQYFELVVGGTFDRLNDHQLLAVEQNSSAGGLWAIFKGSQVQAPDDASCQLAPRLPIVHDKATCPECKGIGVADRGSTVRWPL